MSYGYENRKKTIRFWPAPNANSFRQTNMTLHLQQAKMMQKAILIDHW